MKELLTRLYVARDTVAVMLCLWGLEYRSYVLGGDVKKAALFSATNGPLIMMAIPVLFILAYCLPNVYLDQINPRQKSDTETPLKVETK